MTKLHKTATALILKVKLKINDYSYSVENGFACIGSANIVDGSFEVL